ncbi:MAG: hypothetical protein M9950_00785 [Thermomicrobiales bacterium]|nr:hypothetical protein [Thermomicrobiales bacterium]
MSTTVTKKPTFRREERSEFRTWLAHSVARILSWIVLLTPWPVRDAVANLVGAFSYRTSKGYRRNVESNVSTVLNTTPDDVEVARITRLIFRTNARNFSDLMTLAWRSPNWLRKKCQVTVGGWEVVDAELTKGKGVIFVSAHVGCFDFIGQTVQAFGYPLTVVTGRTTSRFVFDGVTWLRGRRGARMVEPTPSGIRHVIRALRNNECAVIVGDRDFFENGHEVEYFGHKATLPPGAVRIARDTGATIVPIFTRRNRDNTHQIHIHPAIQIEKTSDVNADVDRGMQQLVPVLEAGILGCLEQWVMFQRVWPELPPESIRIFPTGSPLESPLLEKVAQALRAPHPQRKVPRRDSEAPYLQVRISR